MPPVANSAATGAGASTREATNADLTNATATAARVADVIGWYAHAARDLPWRDGGTDAWGVLVSEVMLQQTPVARVEPMWREWMARWPHPADLAAAPQADAIRAWGRLGYPRRAKRLWDCARAIVERHGGIVPSTAEDLLALPGVGEYTAAAVLSFAFGQRAVVLDTNVRRVIARAWDGRPMPSPTLNRAERERAASIVPEDPAQAVIWNVGSMELGALICSARAPKCDRCPLAGDCAWLAAGAQGLDEAPRRTQAWHGTDRQVRGRILALLRAADAPVNITGHASLEDVEPGQLDSCLESLVADGLVAAAERERGTYALA